MPQYFSKNGKKLKAIEPTLNVETLTFLGDIKKVQEIVTINWKHFIKSASATLLSIAIVTLIIGPSVQANIPTNKYNIFSSKPFVMENSTGIVYTGDSRAQRIDEVMREFKCPLFGYGQSFVNEADKNDIPWWLVASVSFQESNCGKKTPINEGEETYNAYGWGVWGGNAYQFDNWEHGIEIVSRYMGNKFFSKGVTETCDIMKTYTPPSNGSWCKGVNYFGDLIQNYESPDFF